ncbi:MAG: hypothetical protein Q8P01_05600 [bacterium]|nr:hypothetical protein [bacterium]
MSEAQEPRFRLSPEFRCELFYTSRDGEIPYDTIHPAVVSVLCYGGGMDSVESSNVAGLVTKHITASEFQRVHKRMVQAWSNEERHAIAEQQATLVAQAVWMAMTDLPLGDPGREPLKLLLASDEIGVGQSA